MFKEIFPSRDHITHSPKNTETEKKARNRDQTLVALFPAHLGMSMDSGRWEINTIQMSATTCSTKAGALIQ